MSQGGMPTPSAVGLDRSDPSDPSSWKMAATTATSLEQRLLKALRDKGYPATSIELDPAKLKGGYICDTMRIFIGYGQDTTDHAARKEVEERKKDPSNVTSLPKAVISRPLTAILKIASPMSNDHDVAMKLRLYEREWHFYETLSSRVPIRVPQHLGSVKDEATGLITEGVLLEDLEVPGAELCPKMDESGVLRTISNMARHHAMFWNMPELSSGALGIKPHNAHWYQPGWGNDVSGYWPTFEAKWRARAGGDAMGPGLPEEAFAIGKAIVDRFAWVQDELSSKPHTFNHGDVKPPNMFMMPGEQPAFIDWQYTAVGKGCQDIVFFLIEGYDVDECRRLEPICLAHYHAALVHNGILGYSIDDLKRDWQLACMHFPFYVAMWFGTTPDDQLVDPSFPRRFVPRAFDCILRNKAHKLLESRAASFFFFGPRVTGIRAGPPRRSPARTPTSACPPSPPASPPFFSLAVVTCRAQGATLESLAAELANAKLQLKQVTKERDKYKAALVTMKDLALGNL